MPGSRRWRLRKFLDEFDAWAERESISDDRVAIVYAWIMSRMDDPYQGVRRAEGFDNLWYGHVPKTYDPTTQRVVTCSYWIEERDRIVQLDNFGLQTLPY